MTLAASRQAPEVDVELKQLAHLLSKAVGDEKSIEVVRQTCGELALSVDEPLSLDDALRVLEAIAEQPGLIGVTARFAKSRLHLSLL